MKIAKRATIIIAVLALLILGANCLVITNENQYSLIRRFGKIDYVIDQAGVSFKLPLSRAWTLYPRKLCCMICPPRM